MCCGFSTTIERTMNKIDIEGILKDLKYKIFPQDDPFVLYKDGIITKKILIDTISLTLEKRIKT